MKTKPAKDARAAIRERETKLRSAAAGLATDPLFADLQPPHLRRADALLADAVKLLDKADSRVPRSRPRKRHSPSCARAHSPGRPGRTDGANDRRARIRAPRRAIKAKNHGTAEALSRRPRPGWATSASPCEKT